jgi:hypothetical protein
MWKKLQKKRIKKLLGSRNVAGNPLGHRADFDADFGIITRMTNVTENIGRQSDSVHQFFTEDGV